MKNILSAIVLVLIAVTSLQAEKIEACAPNPNGPNLVSGWAQDSTVKVYFVYHMFTAAQGQVLREAIENWKPKGNQNVYGIKFRYAGETGGLIDCVGCLTIARQGSYTKDRKRNAMFHPLRQNQMGQLISAWVGLDSVASSPDELRGIILQALGRNRMLWRC